MSGAAYELRPLDHPTAPEAAKQGPGKVPTTSTRCGARPLSAGVGAAVTAHASGSMAGAMPLLWKLQSRGQTGCQTGCQQPVLDMVLALCQLVLFLLWTEHAAGPFLSAAWGMQFPASARGWG